MSPAAKKKEPAPVVALGPVAAPTVRTGGQVVTGAFIIEGLTVFDLASFTEAQTRWLTVALTLGLAFAQNVIEKKQGRKLVGVAK